MKPEVATGESLAARVLAIAERHPPQPPSVCEHCGVPSSWTDKLGRTVIHACEESP